MAANASPSGVSVPIGDLPGWSQVYAEDFDLPVAVGGFPGLAYRACWLVYDDGWADTSGKGTHLPSRVLSVHDGVLDFHIQSVDGLHQVAAPWLTVTRGNTYGRYSVRFRADDLPGYATAWLLWPDSERWPADGEIDFPEGNLDGTSTISAFAHFANSGGGQDVFPTKATYRDWHTATIEWLPGQVTFWLDGALIGVSTTEVPTTAMHWVLQTETSADGHAPAPGVTGHVLVDWVAFWRRA